MTCASCGQGRREARPCPNASKLCHESTVEHSEKIFDRLNKHELPLDLCVMLLRRYIHGCLNCEALRPLTSSTVDGHTNIICSTMRKHSIDCWCCLEMDDPANPIAMVAVYVSKLNHSPGFRSTLPAIPKGTGSTSGKKTESAFGTSEKKNLWLPCRVLQQLQHMFHTGIYFCFKTDE